MENEIISGPDAIETPFPSGGYFGEKSPKSETTTSLKDDLSLVSEKQDEEKCVNFPIPSGVYLFASLNHCYYSQILLSITYLFA